MTQSRSRPVRSGVILTTVALIGNVLASSSAHAALPGADAALTRAPYLSDLTTTSVQVNWATTTQSHGVVHYGPVGNCAAGTAASTPLGNPITVNGVTEYRNTVAVTGLTAGTAYCYRVYTGDTGADLLGSNASPAFTTLEAPDSTTPFSFGVFGDWGDTTNDGVNDGAVNADQANLDARIAASGVRFMISTGDTAYAGGTQTNYGDLNQTGINISGVFGPTLWAVPGQSIPVHGVTGNHGLNSTFISVWPQSASAAASGGVYDMVYYPAGDGVNAANYPTNYYAFTTGGVRFYVLDATWGDSNTGTATGGACGSHCAMYEVDHDKHWTSTSAEYRWLAADLAAHPGGLKFAAFHFPLRSDDASEPSDEYLQRTPGSSATLEQLLHDNGVNLVFNGHAHIYQRNVAPPGGVTSYVSGGGGAKLTSVAAHGCAPTDAYARGWSNTKNKGNACGAASVPTDNAQVFHFLKVSVNGSSVTVAPTDSLGNTFDVVTYNFATDAVVPSAPGGLGYTLPISTKVTLTWTAATDNLGVSAYDIYRDSTLLATVPGTVTTYTDATIVAGHGYGYEVQARDLAGNTRGATVAVNGGPSDTIAPSAPTGLTATATGTTTASLSWTASTDNVGVTGYTIMRQGAAVASVGGAVTTWSDTNLFPGTGYSYQVVATDAVGNASPPSGTATITTTADTVPPTTPGTPVTTNVTATQVGLSWTASTDDVAVVRYEVIRNGSVVATVSGTTYTDATVAASTTYTYAIKAYDEVNNSATSGTLSVTTPVNGSVVSDGFETGNLSGWSTVSGLTVGTGLTHAGTYGARSTSNGIATYAYRTLPATYGDLWAQSWVYVASRSTSANLFGYRSTSGASIVNLYLDTTGRVALRNNIGGVTTYSNLTVSAGAWHRFVLHVIMNGTASSVDVTLDGVTVPGLTLTGQDFGTNLISKLQLGETATGRTYDIAFDDVAVAQSSL
jgi:chitodextrinase